jgi:elongation factor P
MDPETFEQDPVEAEKLAHVMDYMKENEVYKFVFYEGKVVDVRPPDHMVLEVTETEPGLKGDTVSGTTKPATLETGLIVQVPLFVNPGESVRVDTRSGAYLERA